MLLHWPRVFPPFKKALHVEWGIQIRSSGIFLSTFRQPVNGGKTFVLNWVMKLNLFMVFADFALGKIFRRFFSSILLTLCFRYLQTCLKESCMYLSNQPFFETPHKTLKFQEQLLLLQARNIKKHSRVEMHLFCFSTC